MKLPVTAGRTFGERPGERAFAFRTFDALHAEKHITILIHGACGADAGRLGHGPGLDIAEWLKMCGGDALADEWAKQRQQMQWDAIPIRVRRYPARWTNGGKRRDFGAGPKRNQEMIDKEHIGIEPIDLCLALPGGKGTADCVRRARAAGIPVMEVKP